MNAWARGDSGGERADAPRRGVLGLSIVLLCLLLAACAGPRPPQDKPLTHFTVQKGDTLYAIAWRYGYDYREVAAWNGIDPPYRIYPGQRLRIMPPLTYREAKGSPDEGSAIQARNSPPSPSGPRPPQPERPASAQEMTKPVPTATARAPKVEKRPARTHTSGKGWRWPVKGKVVAGFAPNKERKGIDIRGRAGDKVVAAESGDVVYSGSGLIGYGNLVIIKHNDIYLSAYGHNRRLLVAEGERVERGAPIAEMGQTAKNGAILHFEIRRNGTPVDPMRYLP